MTRKEILETAQLLPKGDWRTYSALKKKLSESLSEAEYQKFISELANILRV